jgi:tRNA(fMet)-specific endonuclease VapC
MATICLDTNIIIDLLNGKESLSHFNSATQIGLNTTIISLMELYYGSFKSNRIEDTALVESLSDDMNIIRLAEQDAKLAGMIMATLDKKGKKLDFRDVVIAAICINNDMQLLLKISNISSLWRNLVLRLWIGESKWLALRDIILFTGNGSQVRYKTSRVDLSLFCGYENSSLFYHTITVL